MTGFDKIESMLTVLQDCSYAQLCSMAIIERDKLNECLFSSNKREVLGHLHALETIIEAMHKFEEV